MQQQTSVTNRRRLGCLLVLFAILLLFGLIALGYRMLFQASWLQEKAASQWTRQQTVTAARGDITDRDGTIIAGSTTSWTVALLPQTLKDAQDKEDKRAAQEGRPALNLKEATAQVLSQILDMDTDVILQKLANDKKYEVWLKRLVTDDQAQAIRNQAMPGVRLIEDTKRYYPMNSLLCQVLGFTSVDGVGLEGLEATMNRYLTGTDGYVKLETDVSGRELPESIEEYVDATNGANVELTISAPIQSITEKIMAQALEEQGAEKVCAIVMDPNTMEVLAMANLPDFDLNNIPRTDGEALSRLSRNTAVADAYEVGSIFKILTLAAALDTGAAKTNSAYFCPGYHIVNGTRIKCWSQRPHGSQSLAEAAANSCNPAFMQMGLAMGADTFYGKLYDFGLGAKTGSLFASESTGIVTSIKYIRDTDLARIAFGQSIAVTPLQMITAASAAINGGTLKVPMIVRRVVREDGVVLVRYETETVRQVVSEETSKTVREILTGVVDNGTGRNGAVPGYSVGGKTGTAQKYDENGRVTSANHVATFIGFAPADDPQVIVMVLVDNPSVGSHYGSTAAAPYASKILEETLHYLNIAPDRKVEEGTVEVPDVRLMDLESATASVASHGLTPIVEGYGESVYQQSPMPGTRVQSGEPVILQLNQYREMVDTLVVVPDLAGMTPAEAVMALREVGLKLVIQGTGYRATRQTPAASTYAMEGDEVFVSFYGALNP